jgi:hydrogenase expression/formation protein HypC
VCIGAPAVVLDVDYENMIASVDYGDGIPRTVIIGILDQIIKRGELVIVHAGVIVSKITEEELIEQVEFFRELLGEDIQLTQIYRQLIETHRKITQAVKDHN